jgi:hypothetical protein
MLPAACRSGDMSRIRLKTERTFKSKTFAKAESGWVSKGAPQVAPAFAIRMWTRGTCADTAATKRVTSLGLERSAGIEEMLVDGKRIWREETAAVQASALREVMIRVETPAWRRLRIVS